MSELCWKIENDICRCCHGEGSFANLAVPQSIDGREEVYADMLRESLDINLVQVEGEMNNMTYTICGICIMRLRDAFMFKQQVLQCEDKFQEMYAKKFIQVSLPLKTSIKVELIDSDSADDEFILRDTDKDEDNDEIITTKIKQEKADAPEKKRLRPRKVAEKPKKAPMLKKMLTKKTQLKKKKKEEEEKKESEAEKNSVGAKQTVVHPGDRVVQSKFRLLDTDYRKEGDTYFCSRCDKPYLNRTTMGQHVRLKHYRFCCPYCDKIIFPEALLEHNLKDHQIDDRPKCHACDKLFSTSSILNVHKKFFHMLGERRKCPDCDFETYSGDTLRRHALKHTSKEKNHRCTFCGKCFLRKKTMKVHERIHTNDKRFSCKECDQKFVQKASLNYHMTKYHPNV